MQDRSVVACMQGLKRVAQSGVTVAAVIHQPSYETFSLFDDLVLLAKGGLTAYCGQQSEVQVCGGYLKSLRCYPGFKFGSVNNSS